MKTVKEQIKQKLADKGISIAEFGRQMGFKPRAMQTKLSSGTFTLEELEAVERVLGITIFSRYAQNDFAHEVNEPQPNSGNGRTINIVIHLGQSADNPLAQKLEEGLLEWLASQGKKP